MKRLISLLAALALCLCLAIPAGAADATSANLKFNDGTFKIIQVTDTQEFILSSALTQEFLYDLAKTEDPDLFVLTGDNSSTGGAKDFPKPIAQLMVKASVDNLMSVFDKIYKDFGIPVTMVYGNHDNEAGPENVTRAEQFAMYAAHPSFIGYYVEAADKGTGENDEQGDHYGTHNLIVNNNEGTAPAFNIWMFDSGSYDTRGGYSSVKPQQIEWFKAENAKTGNLPSLAFQHIAVPEVYDHLTPSTEGAENTYSRNFVIDGEKVTKYVSANLPASAGGEMRESPGPGEYNYGQYDALCEAGVLAVFYGHDHTNTYILKPEGKTHIANSMSTGFGSYGDIDRRGVRMITVRESDMTYDSENITYQTFYGQGFLQSTRLSMFQSITVFGNFFDWFTFKPLLWLLGLFSA